MVDGERHGMAACEVRMQQGGWGSGVVALVMLAMMHIVHRQLGRIAAHCEEETLHPCVWEHTVAIKVTCLCACGTRSAAPTHGAPAHAAPARAAPARAAPARAAPNRAAPTRADPARAAPARAAPARTATTHAAPTLAAPPTSPAAAPRSTPTHPHVHLAQLMARVGMGGAGSRVENRRRGTE
ncbi:unnamed protein product [Closterium sp. NIES-53]